MAAIDPNKKCDKTQWDRSTPSEAEIKECLPDSCTPEGGFFSSWYSTGKNHQDAEECARGLRAMGYDAHTKVVPRRLWADAVRVIAYRNDTEKEIGERLGMIKDLLPCLEKDEPDAAHLRDYKTFLLKWQKTIKGIRDPLTLGGGLRTPTRGFLFPLRMISGGSRRQTSCRRLSML